MLNFLTCFLTSGLEGKTKGLARHIAFSILDLNFWSSLSRKIICSISPVSLKKTLTLALIPTEEGGTFQILKIFLILLLVLFCFYNNFVIITFAGDNNLELIVHPLNNNIEVKIMTFFIYKTNFSTIKI